MYHCEFSIYLQMVTLIFDQMLRNTVEPLCNKHFGISAVKNVLVTPVGIYPYYGGVFYCVLYLEGLSREVSLNFL